MRIDIVLILIALRFLYYFLMVGYHSFLCCNPLNLRPKLRLFGDVDANIPNKMRSKYDSQHKSKPYFTISDMIEPDRKKAIPIASASSLYLPRAAV